MDSLGRKPWWLLVLQFSVKASSLHCRKSRVRIVALLCVRGVLRCTRLCGVDGAHLGQSVGAVSEILHSSIFSACGYSLAALNGLKTRHISLLNPGVYIVSAVVLAEPFVSDQSTYTNIAGRDMIVLRASLL